MTGIRRRRGRWHGAIALVLLACLPAVARADWTTYRGDAMRSGIDTSSTGSLPFAPAWTSPNLGGEVWGQPLVHDGLVIVATESDEVVALSEATGQVVWQASTGTPVPFGKLACSGDIMPTVGITSTPVIDPSSNEVFAVADTLNGSTIEHKLYAFNVSTGAAVAGFPVDVEPPGDDPAAQLQRAALALDNGEIVIGYGGNDGDCGTYHGWLVAVPESGGAEHTFEVDPGSGDDEGAIWGSGGGPAVDSSGNLWVATGNGNSGSTFGYQESVVKLGQSLNLLDYWAPSDWQSLDGSDLDLGSSEPVLLPNDLVFEIGKQGIGYLLNASDLGHVGAPADQAKVCGGSWGGAIYSGGIIYATCTDGLRALALNASAPSFSPVSGWHVNSNVDGPPTIAGGLVWATDAGTNNGSTLYGLNPQTGEIVVNHTTPSTEHFATPSASDGKLFLSTGETVEADAIANAATSPTSPAPVPADLCTLTVHRNRIQVHRPRRRRHENRAPAPYGTIALTATCSQATNVAVRGTVTEQLGRKPKHGHAKTRRLRISQVQASLAGGVAATLELRLPDAALSALTHATKRSGTFTLTAPGIRVVTPAARLRL